ncbi:MAG TPA: MBL fold metallo-hydrolase, partial [Firmicutes bacterium]|nr:MBL fold metallo-hydrolase [Bacillota bacterium]
MDNHFIFLGTGGARFVVSRQLRWTAGIWCHFEGKRILIDPGPGTLVRFFNEGINLNPEQLDAIIVTHRHLDHSADVNVMVESMTRGTFNRRGAFYAPADALNTVEPVIFSYLRESLERVEVLKEGGEYYIGDVRFSSPVRHI